MEKRRVNVKVNDKLNDFVHRFVPATAPRERRTLLLLHGTGGDEQDLLPLGEALLPGAAILSPRGKVLERGMPRFFRRLSEGVFDEPDLIARTHELAKWIREATEHYKLNADHVIAAGFSNGANIAASMLLLEPKVLAGAILFHAMVPLQPKPIPNLQQKPVLISAGRTDPIIPMENTERLAALLRTANAEVSVAWFAHGHALTLEEVRGATDWMKTHTGVARPSRA